MSHISNYSQLAAHTLSLHCEKEIAVQRISNFLQSMSSAFVSFLLLISYRLDTFHSSLHSSNCPEPTLLFITFSNCYHHINLLHYNYYRSHFISYSHIPTILITTLRRNLHNFLLGRIFPPKVFAWTFVHNKNRKIK